MNNGPVGQCASSCQEAPLAFARIYQEARHRRHLPSSALEALEALAAIGCLLTDGMNNEDSSGSQAAKRLKAQARTPDEGYEQCTSTSPLEEASDSESEPNRNERFNLGTTKMQAGSLAFLRAPALKERPDGMNNEDSSRATKRDEAGEDPAPISPIWVESDGEGNVIKIKGNGWTWKPDESDSDEGSVSKIMWKTDEVDTSSGEISASLSSMEEGESMSPEVTESERNGSTSHVIIVDVPGWNRK